MSELQFNNYLYTYVYVDTTNDNYRIDHFSESKLILKTAVVEKTKKLIRLFVAFYSKYFVNRRLIHAERTLFIQAIRIIGEELIIYKYKKRNIANNDMNKY